MGNNVERYKIITMQGRTIFNEIVLDNITKSKHYVQIRDDNGNLKVDLFKGYLVKSLEQEKLAEVYKELNGKDDKFATKIKDDYYTTAVIAVVFDFVQKLYNRQKTENGNLYVKNGYDIDYKDLVDHVVVKDGELLAIEVPYGTFLGTYSKVKKPIDTELLDKYFIYDKKYQCYRIAKKANGKKVDFPTIKSKQDLREYLYLNGFDCDGKHYIRYKRSTGSSRIGHCLFIQDNLYEPMMEWTRCGLNQSDITDLASWEAYISLTLSDMVDKIKIPLHSILFMRDKFSTFRDKVVSVSNDEEGNLKSEEKEIDIMNNLFDGESILDESIFNQYGYKDKGMMLLRNKYFKSCAFNGKIQKWFSDNDITQIKQLNGFTTARDVKDIKLIITESSLKYFKLKGINIHSSDKEFKEVAKEWLKYVDPYFGIVKTEKPTSYFDGGMVQTTYQILNTLDMTDQQVEEFLTPTIDYLLNIRKEPIYMRHYLKNRINAGLDDDIDEIDLLDEGKEQKDIRILKSRMDCILDTMRLSDDFARTKLYSDIRKDVTTQIKEKMKIGKVLVNGTYATIFGNGAELLKSSTSKDNVMVDPVLKDNEIYINRFSDNKMLFCARSPHITMGNILLGKNVKSAFYDTYFNLSKEIVCVNAINFNIQQRLNGCDYDSDTMLITDNQILIDAANKHINEFCVPTCEIESSKKALINDNHSKVDLDQHIAENKIGEIVNLSQYLNSILWHIYHTTQNIEECKNIYLNICKLAVLSGLEIDSAKKSFKINKNKVLEDLKKTKEKYVAKYGIPQFFSYITLIRNAKANSLSKKKVKLKPEQMPLEPIYSGMEQIYNYVTGNNIPIIKGTFDLKLSDLINSNIEIDEGNNDYKYKIECLNATEEYAIKLNKIKIRMKAIGPVSFLVEEKAELLKEYFDFISKKLKTKKILMLLLGVLDTVETDEQGKKKYYPYRSLLFTAICKDKKRQFYQLLEASNLILEELVQEDNIVTKDRIYDYYYIRK